MSTVKTLVLVRHGAKEQTGQPNPGLTAEGRRQAAQLSFSTEVVCVSPLRRAQETLEHSDIKTQHQTVNPIFREWRQGVSTFLEGEDVKDKESEGDFYLRVVQARLVLLDEISANHITVISHEDFLLTLQKWMKVVDPSQPDPVHLQPGQRVVRRVSFP